MVSEQVKRVIYEQYRSDSKLVLLAMSPIKAFLEQRLCKQPVFFMGVLPWTPKGVPLVWGPLLSQVLEYYFKDT